MLPPMHRILLSLLPVFLAIGLTITPRAVAQPDGGCLYTCTFDGTCFGCHTCQNYWCTYCFCSPYPGATLKDNGPVVLTKSEGKISVLSPASVAGKQALLDGSGRLSRMLAMRAQGRMKPTNHDLVAAAALRRGLKNIACITTKATKQP